jgi:hypothetical protein
MEREMDFVIDVAQVGYSPPGPFILPIEKHCGVPNSFLVKYKV